MYGIVEWDRLHPLQKRVVELMIEREIARDQGDHHALPWIENQLSRLRTALEDKAFNEAEQIGWEVIGHCQDALTDPLSWSLGFQTLPPRPAEGAREPLGPGLLLH